MHGHPWDPEYRYHYANDEMRTGIMTAAFQLREIKKDWGGFGSVLFASLSLY